MLVDILLPPAVHYSGLVVAGSFWRYPTTVADFHFNVAAHMSVQARLSCPVYLPDSGFPHAVLYAHAGREERNKRAPTPERII